MAPFISAITGEEVQFPVKESATDTSNSSCSPPRESHRRMEICDNMVRVSRDEDRKREVTPKERWVRDQVQADKASLRSAVDKFRQTMSLQQSMEKPHWDIP